MRKFFATVLMYPAVMLLLFSYIIYCGWAGFKNDMPFLLDYLKKAVENLEKATD
jgi:hypothetical protein